MYTPHTPHLFTPLSTPAEMRQWDSLAEADYGIPSVLLMENAAREAFSVIHAHLPPPASALVITGKGNNGGDGFALARALHDAGYTVRVCHLYSRDSMQGAAKIHLHMAEKAGVPLFFNDHADWTPPSWLHETHWQRPSLIIDAITGTGLKGDLREPAIQGINFINEFYGSSHIFALDIPSGLCGYTGVPRPEAVHAHCTITFETGKPGLFFPEAKSYTGAVHVRTIGIPRAIKDSFTPTWQLLHPHSFPPPSPFLHKGQAGRILIIGGSASMAGAPLLTALGALHGGCGIVHLACPGAILPQLRQGWPEIILHGLGKGDNWEEDINVSALLQSTNPAAVIIGPGMGREPGAYAVVKAILAEKCRPPVVVDADALSLFSLRAPSPLALLRPYDILTPHPGEMANMLPCSYFSAPATSSQPLETDAEQPMTQAPQSLPHNDTGNSKSCSFPLDLPLSQRECIDVVQQDRGGALQAFTRASEAVLVLKGPGTLIGQRSAPITLAPFATPTLAVGGSGDVLAGAIGACLGLGYTPYEAACLGVYLHGRAGELLLRTAPRGHLAQTIADTLPLVWQELCTSPHPGSTESTVRIPKK